MRLAVAWVFSYSGELPGAVHDIYYAGKHFMEVCDSLLIFSDVHSDENITIMSQNSIGGRVKPDALNIIQNFKDSKILRIVQEGPDLLGELISLLDQDISSIVFYFSGHSDDQTLICPDQSGVAFTEILNIITNLTSSTTQILFILDACYVGNFNLPYRMDDRGVYQIEDVEVFPEHPIICISSTTSVQKSRSETFGSEFTRELFSDFQTNNRNLGSLLERSSRRVGEIQEANIYASDPSLTSLWPWIYGSDLKFRRNSAFILKILPPKNELSDRPEPREISRDQEEMFDSDEEFVVI